MDNRPTKNKPGKAGNSRNEPREDLLWMEPRARRAEVRRLEKRRRKHRTWLVVLITIALTLTAAGFIQARIADRYEARFRTDRNTLDFYRALLIASKDAPKVYLADIVPFDWDTVTALPTYSNPDSKITAAGYRYADYLYEQYYEGILSLLFMKGGSVVYYVDTLFPRVVEFHPLDSGLYEMVYSHEADEKWSYRAVIGPEYAVDPESTFFSQNRFDTAAREQRPFISAEPYGDNGVKFTLDVEYGDGLAP